MSNIFRPEVVFANSLSEYLGQMMREMSTKKKKTREVDLYCWIRKFTDIWVQGDDQELECAICRGRHKKTCSVAEQQAHSFHCEAVEPAEGK